MRKEEKTRLTREKIIQAALREFGEKGYYGASINAISAAGINKGLIYHNFRDRDALYLACVKRSLDDMVGQVTGWMDVDPDLDYFTARMRFFRSEEMEARIFLETAIHPPAELAEDIRACRKELEVINRREFEKLLGRYRLRPGIRREDAFLWFQYMQDSYNAAFFRREGQNGSGQNFQELLERHEKGAEKFLDLMLFGIADREEEK